MLNPISSPQFFHIHCEDYAPATSLYDDNSFIPVIRIRIVPSSSSFKEDSQSHLNMFKMANNIFQAKICSLMLVVMVIINWWASDHTLQQLVPASASNWSASRESSSVVFHQGRQNHQMQQLHGSVAESLTVCSLSDLSNSSLESFTDCSSLSFSLCWIWEPLESQWECSWILPLHQHQRGLSRSFWYDQIISLVHSPLWTYLFAAT
jgi:hypothetical protein